ncbi:hypothetical protein AKJ09_05651 [Labilithrix luteola]|uniref:Uncharacterized protein n=2 Tax=Labilithrix luteola TaxID=1391654 RepID=A0A0K1PZR9_9BACT|nr:hypothetical protein AKJ09_05651 [Labilithrix luteola]
MCDHGQVPEGVRATFFRPETKCCTFQPHLPNYHVGAILADTREELREGQARVREQIRQGIGVTPHHLGPSRKWTLLYTASSHESFGRTSALVCPYLDGGRCSIWHHREVVCSTYYCKVDGGAPGKRFWVALKDYLTHVERELMRWSASQVAGSEVNQPKVREGKLHLHELEDRRPPDEMYRATWGSWATREEEFYIACYERVRSLDRAGYARIVEETKEGRALLGRLKSARDALDVQTKLPERLVLHKSLRSLPVIQGGVLVTTPYNAYDSFNLEPELYEILGKFQPTTTVAATRKQLADEQGIEFDDALLTHLHRHEILVTAHAPPEGGTCDETEGPRAAQVCGTGRSNTRS